jgi:hypothetical protein
VEAHLAATIDWNKPIADTDIGGTGRDPLGIQRNASDFRGEAGWPPPALMTNGTPRMTPSLSGER